MAQDVGIACVKVLWCHSHLVSLFFIQKTLCDLFLLLFCLYCCVGIVREKRGGRPRGLSIKYRKNFEGENFCANFAVLWLFTKVFFREIWRGAAKASNPRRFSLSKVSRYIYGRTFLFTY